jgi:hypothetical protein
MRRGDLEARLKVWLKPDLWKKRAGVVLVEETSEGGKALVKFELPPGEEGIQWHLAGSSLFPVLKEEKNADGVFMLKSPRGGWEAHVVECKKTVGTRTWRDAREQMRWTIARLRAVG